MNRWFIRIAIQKKRVTIRLDGKYAIFSVPEIQDFFSVVGVTHFDGKVYFPKDGRKFLEAIFDYYFLRLNGLLYPPG